MKKMICFVLPLLVLTLYGEETIHLWSGRLVTLPGNDSWQICAEHGRILASGKGDVRIDLPPLEPGSTLDAELIRNGKKQKLRFHSQKVLQGHVATMDNSLPDSVPLYKLGCGILAEPSSGRPDKPTFTGNFPETLFSFLTFCFPDKQDFPLTIGEKWDSVSAFRAKNPGTLRVLYDKKEQILDIRGNFTYILLKSEGKQLFIFPPDFNLDNVDNVLLLKQLLDNHASRKLEDKK